MIKRLTAVILAGAMLTFSLSACDRKATDSASGLTKIRVELFDRNDAPEGQGTTTDNKMTQWIRQEVNKIGLDVEFVACPRDQEVQKLNAWMASSNAPDIVISYNTQYTFQRFAEQNGICELDKYLQEFPLIKEKMQQVLPYGKYNDKQFAIPGIRTLQPSPNMKIRKDWLDKLGLPMPKTTEELYTTLKAFKEKDPGNVGKDNVVPFAMSAPGVVGNVGSFGSLKYPFGIDVIGTFGGTYKDGVFKSAVDIPEAKEFYLYLNKLYQEGLIHREFAVDNNGSRYTQHVTSGVAGLVDNNGAYMDNLTMQSVSDVDWAVMEPLPDKNGNKVMSGYTLSRWLNMIPKSSKVPEAAMKYINWMIEAKADITLTYGFENTHYTVNDGVIIQTTDPVLKKDYWKGQDLNLIGYVNYMVPRDKLNLIMPEKEAQKTAVAMDYTDRYARLQPVITEEMPVAQDKTSTLEKFVNDSAAKLIVAKDFETEYASFVSGWYSLGGGDYDKELSAELNKLSFKR